MIEFNILKKLHMNSTLLVLTVDYPVVNTSIRWKMTNNRHWPATCFQIILITY